MDRIADIFAGITAVALVTTVVAHPQTAKVVTAIGNAYATSVRAALGSAAR